jgi:hypothetical protein
MRRWTSRWASVPRRSAFSRAASVAPARISPWARLPGRDEKRERDACRSSPWSPTSELCPCDRRPSTSCSSATTPSPHLDSEIQEALAECFRCARQGGGCLIRCETTNRRRPPELSRCAVWRAPLGWSPVSPASGVDVARPRYDLSFEITPGDGATGGATVLKTTYLAIPVERVAGLMRTVGFANVRRVDARFFQPVLIGTRPMA